jgi:hypothetical protein
VEEHKNSLGRALETQGVEWKGKRRSRVLRGKRPPYIPLKPESWICPGWKPDMSGTRGRACPVESVLAVFRNFGWICPAKGRTCSVILGKK